MVCNLNASLSSPHLQRLSTLVPMSSQHHLDDRLCSIEDFGIVAVPRLRWTGLTPQYPEACRLLSPYMVALVG